MDSDDYTAAANTATRKLLSSGGRIFKPNTLISPLFLTIEVSFEEIEKLCNIFSSFLYEPKSVFLYQFDLTNLYLYPPPPFPLQHLFPPKKTVQETA